MRRLFFVLFALVSPFVWNCSENDTPAVVDHSEPEVRIYYPYDTEPETFVVNDSTLVYFSARDLGPNGQPADPTKVELWFSRPGTAAPVLIGTAGQPISIDQVPVDIRPFVNVPAGWSLYTRRWYTGPTPLPPVGTPINTGTDVQLFAVAYDAAGNVGRTPGVIRIHVTNFGDDIGPPRPDFTVSPQAGTTETIFVFDASLTTDEIDPLEEISVRWDFDGNPGNGWDIDWEAGARADQTQSWQYTTPRLYRAILQAHNSYIPDSVDFAVRDIGVSSIGGDPHPPEESNYSDIPHARYVLGDTAYVLNGLSYQADSNERPIHQVDFTSDYRIEKTEVTNQLYLNYLREALNPDSATAEYRGGVLYSWDPDNPDAPQDIYLIVSAERTKIYFNEDTRSFAIQRGFEDHPVTGTTWFGATAYALAYGMRLPTEAEWEVAARGANEAWNYPFAGGTELTAADGPQRVNYAPLPTESRPFMNTTTPRGFYNGQNYQGFQTQDTPSAFGTYDMAGNVSEWVGDWFGTYPPGLNTDPQGPLEGTERVVRGGSFMSSRADVRCTARKGFRPDESLVSVGFRTAYIRPVLGR